MPLAVRVAVCGLAGWRIAHLWTTDRITRAARRRALRVLCRDRSIPLDEIEDTIAADPDPPFLAYLASCTVCTGVWATVACWWAPTSVTGPAAAAGVALLLTRITTR